MWRSLRNRSKMSIVSAGGSGDCLRSSAGGADCALAAAAVMRRAIRRLAILVTLKAEYMPVAARLGLFVVELTADDIRDINGAVSQIEVHGARYPEAAQRLVGR